MKNKYEEIRNLHLEDKYPTPDQDCMEYIIENSRFSCPSACSFFHWFGTEINKIKNDEELNIVLISVESDKIIYGITKCQAVFYINDVISKEILYK